MTDRKGTLECTKLSRNLQDFPEKYSRIFGLFVVYIHYNRIKKKADILTAKLSK
jgi:hypothetical protein